MTFGDALASNAWSDLEVRSLANKSEKAVLTLKEETPNGEIILTLSIRAPYLVRLTSGELAVNGGEDNFIDSRAWPGADNDEWVEFTLDAAGPGAADLTSLNLEELRLSFTGNDMIEFSDGDGGTALRYLSEVDSISRYGAGERLEGLTPLSLANVGGPGDGSWALRMTARAFGAVDVTSITSFRVKSLKFSYEVAVPAVANPLPSQGLILHLDAYSLLGSAVDGAALSDAWQDLSGQNNHADSGDRPVFLADGGAGYPAVRFDGVDDYLEAPVGLDFQASVFVVFSNERNPLLANHQDTLLAAPGTGDRLQLFSSKSGTTAPDYPAFTSAPGAGLQSAHWVDGLDTTGLTGEIFSNRYYIGSAIFSQTPAASSLLLGASDRFGANAGAHKVREILVYNTALSASERLAVEAYLSEKYRISTRRFALNHPVERYPHIAGTQQFGTQYGFGESEVRGLDYAHAMLRQGSRVAKFRLSNRYDNEDGFTSIPTINTLVELARDQPEIKEILDLPFTDYMFWVASFSVPDWSNQLDATGLKPDKAQDIYDEVYALAVYLLQTYSGTGKTFYLGNWEGDWKFAGPNAADTTLVPANRIQGMIDWANIRQQAVDDAKADTPHSDVEVWYYLEANRMDWTREGLPCVVNSVLPSMPKLDLLSFSSYSLHKDNGSTAPVDEMHADLDILKAAIDAKTASAITGSRLIIGEYGYLYNSGNYADFEDFAWEHAIALRNYLSWQGGTLRYILQWQFFNEAEAENGLPKEMCQIDNQNAVRPLYHLHENMFRRMREWMEDYYLANGTVPSARAYSDQAVRMIDRTLVQPYVPDVSPWPDLFVSSLHQIEIPPSVSSLAQATAGSVYDRHGRAMPNSAFSWTLEPTQQGVSLDGSGVISVQGNASPDAYTLSVNTPEFSHFSSELNFSTTLPVVSLYDKLDDFSKLDAARSDLSELEIVSDNAALRFEGDASRVKRVASIDPQGLTWHIPELDRFHAKVYHFDLNTLETKLGAETSVDGQTWTPLALRVDPPKTTANSWNRAWIAPLNPLPANTNYLRLSLKQPTQAWNPQIGEVILFGSATGYEFWKQQAFPDLVDQADPNVSGPDADPLGAGVSNLYRYFTDTPLSANVQAKFPELRRQSGQLFYTLPFDPIRSDVRVQVKGSLDLVNWNYTLFDSQSESADPDDGWLWLNEDLLPDSDKKFFKLELSL